MDPSEWLLINRIVRFGETDAAGVVHFHHLLRWCHEAYEESLQRFGIAAAEVFPRPDISLVTALPIVHCSADFLRPMACGDLLTIQLKPRQLNERSFEIRYEFSSRMEGLEPIEALAYGLTRHRAVDSKTRKSCTIPSHITQWLIFPERLTGTASKS
jgi:1,4-dihydroxy-2-naphthoyl-CoA hydrolase